MVLAAIAQATSRIRLTTTATVLSVLDPVRVYQDFATLDLISHGRAEITAGRSAFAEPFALFGEDASRYDQLFADKLELLLRIRADEPVNWTGRVHPPLREAVVPPRAMSQLPVWVAVGGAPELSLRTFWGFCARVLVIQGGRGLIGVSDPRHGSALVCLTTPQFGAPVVGSKVHEPAPKSFAGTGSPQPRSGGTLNDGHVSQAADRLTSTRARRAAAARDLRPAGTASPVPKSVSSGVCPRNAECGSTWLCSFTWDRHQPANGAPRYPADEGRAIGASGTHHASIIEFENFSSVKASRRRRTPVAINAST